MQKTSEELNERLVYLKNRINTLTIECLAAGVIPKIKTGQQMSRETLFRLRTEIENVIARQETNKNEIDEIETKQKKQIK